MRSCSGWWAGSTSATSRTRPPPRSRRPASVSSARRPPTWPSGGRAAVRGGARFLYQPEGAIVRADATIAAQARRRGRGRAPVGGHAGRTAAGRRRRGRGDDGGGAVRAPAASSPPAPGPRRSSGRSDRSAAAADARAVDLLRRTGRRCDPDGDRLGRRARPAALHRAERVRPRGDRGPPVGPADRSRCPARAGRGTRGRIVEVHRRIDPAPALTRSETCLYTVSPDEDFVIDRAGPLWWRPRAPVTGSSSRPSSARCWRTWRRERRPASRSSGSAWTARRSAADAASGLVLLLVLRLEQQVERLTEDVVAAPAEHALGPRLHRGHRSAAFGRERGRAP